MFHKLDDWMVDKYDKAGIYLQKRGIPLTEVHVSAAALSLASGLALDLGRHPVSPTIVLTGLVWGGWLMAYLRWAKQNKDYYLSERMMRNLNAKALFYRDHQVWVRFGFLSLFLIMIPSAIGYFLDGEYMGTIISILFWLGPLSMWYLNPCTFIGPGEFASKKKNAVINNAIPQAF